MDTSSRILRLSTSISHTSAHQCTNLLCITWCALILTTGALWCTPGATSQAQVWCRLAPSVSWDGHTLPWADQLVIQGPIMGLPSHSCLRPLFSKVLPSFSTSRPWASDCITYDNTYNFNIVKNIIVHFLSKKRCNTSFGILLLCFDAETIDDLIT